VGLAHAARSTAEQSCVLGARLAEGCHVALLARHRTWVGIIAVRSEPALMPGCLIPQMADGQRGAGAPHCT
jgi:hypothetical protein